MIVKIWPIKNSYGKQIGKVGGVKGLSNAFDYVNDDSKCIVDQRDMDLAFIDESEELDEYIAKESDIGNTMNYMANTDKVKGKFVSGYMCDADKAKEAFLFTQAEMKKRYPNKKTGGNIAYHIVQSFPEDIDISDEEVHRCGIELVRKLDKYQAYICSHVHPEIDEDGIVHGKCKHNHILISAYIHPDKIDPEKPDVIKYNACKESYRQLQIWNDEIALDHGFPIIRNPEMERTYSWKERQDINKGLSWKQQVRNDIEVAKQKTRNWQEFIKEMNSLGYQIKEGKHTTFIAPDGKHRVRGNALGERFIKDNIQKYWILRDEIKSELTYRQNENRQYTIKDIIANASSPLYVDIPLGSNQKIERPTYPLSLDKLIMSQEAINSYFDLESYYEIKNEENQVIDSVQGFELYNHFTSMLKSENEKFKQSSWWENEQEKQRWKVIQQQERKEQQYYSDNKFKNSKTKQTYKISLFTKDGRLKTDLELIFTLAYIVIHAEQGRWEQKDVPKSSVREAYFGPTAWKAQNMMDSIQIAQEEGLENQFDIDNRLNTTGAALSRARAAVKRNEKVKSSMETLKQAVDDYETVKYQVENIFTLPDSDEKYLLLHENEIIIEKYNKAKHLMHMHKVENPADIFDFKKRYIQVEKNVEEANLLLDEKKEEYRRLKKLQYNTSLAQDVRYCYGPEYQLDEANIEHQQTTPYLETDK